MPAGASKRDGCGEFTTEDTEGHGGQRRRGGERIRCDPHRRSARACYTRGEWQIIVNRSISQWGKEDQYTDDIKAQEVGRAKVKTENVSQPIETFTIRAEPGGNNAALVLEWEKTRIRIPFQAQKG